MKYAVAILNTFESENRITFVDEISKAKALKLALVIQVKSEDAKAEQSEWNDSLPDDYETLTAELWAQGEVCCCVEELPS